MGFCKNMFAHWGDTAKLAALFVPMTIVWLIVYNADLIMEGSVETRLQNVAEGDADKADRNLFERYGDVKAFDFTQVLVPYEPESVVKMMVSQLEVLDLTQGIFQATSPGALVGKTKHG